MKTPANSDATFKNKSDSEKLRALRHDINNQLSNIHLAAEQLRYEIPDASSDCTFYLDSILASSEKIHNLVRKIEE